MSLSNAAELKGLEHSVGKTVWTVTAPLFLKLVTVAVTEADTPATITQATYTGYAPLSIAGTDWNTAAAGAMTNSAVFTFGNCTAGSSVCTGWCITTATGTGGDIIHFGAFGSSVTVNTTQTPPSFAAGQLSLTAD